MSEITHMGDFVGKKIQRTLINDSKNIMYWLVDDKWYSLNAIGDCCSYSWYEHCDNADALDNATILEYDYTYEDSQQSGFDNEIKINMMKFKTNKGYCTIEFRNESNGYYSGWTEIHSVDGDITEGKYGRESANVMKDF